MTDGIRISEQILSAGDRALKKCAPQFEGITQAAEQNTCRVLAAFQKARVSETMFAGSTGYAYGDRGREVLETVYADVFGAEAALVRNGFVNGTHAIGCALFAGLKSGDTLLSATGDVYDTLKTLIGLSGDAPGSLRDYGIGYRSVPLCPNGLPDIPAVLDVLRADLSIRSVFIQRSKGYSERQSLSCGVMGDLIKAVKVLRPDVFFVVDNCYGEFVETFEPCHVGADLIAGSLIKNPGGSLAPTGGYVAGRKDLVEAAAARMTVPGIGGECGATLGLLRLYYQGFFVAPHVVGEALKTAVFCAALFHDLGFSVAPAYDAERYDIIQTVCFGAPEPLLEFCKGIQLASPVDSFVTPEPWDMPGYDCPVVMAAGAFVQGASIELSCDAPMRPPYTAFLQGGITFEAGKTGILLAADRILKNGR